MVADSPFPTLIDPMKKRTNRASSLTRSGKRANAVIDAMLKQMQRGLREPKLMEGPVWDQLFGAKQSMVVNVQKLVQALAALPVQTVTEISPAQTNPEGERLTDEEMRLLTAWLAEGNAPQN